MSFLIDFILGRGQEIRRTRSHWQNQAQRPPVEPARRVDHRVWRIEHAALFSARARPAQRDRQQIRQERAPDREGPAAQQLAAHSQAACGRDARQDAHDRRSAQSVA